MSEQKWKSGAVGINPVHGYRSIYVAGYCDTHGRTACWHNESGMSDPGDSPRRPLVVIDPEQTKGKGFLPDWLRYHASEIARESAGGVASVADDLRYIADQIEAATKPPAPPKPDEPLGLGAVVEDAEGGRWIKIDEHSDCNDWVDLGAHSHKPDDENETVRHFYRNITAVKVLSAGVVA